MNNTQPKTNNFMIPLAIIIAGVLVAGAVFFNSGGNTSNTAKTQQTKAAPQQTGSIDNINPITKSDHIRGNPNAKVMIVEYSDFECPFCKGFHDTMNQIIEEYGKSGDVGWVYRHFPLDSLHPRNARIVASVSECIVDQKGNNGFWEFADSFFEVTPSNDRTNLAVVLPKIYSDMGVDQAKIEACVASGKYDKDIQDDIDNAVATGGRGTPWSIVISSSGETFPISGAQPYNSVKQLIDISLEAQ